MQVIDRIALILAIVGGLNWGSIGLFRFDLVAWICGGQASVVARVIYTLVGLAAEEQGNAPDRGQAHQGIDHAADGAAGAAEQEGDQVKAEDADAAPIQAADNGQNQSNLIHDHGKNLLILVSGA